MVKSKPTASPKKRRALKTLLNVIIYEAPDLAGQWIAHCLETDIVTQGNSVADAIEMMAEAIELIAVQNVSKGRPPVVYSTAPVEVFEMFKHAEDLATRILRIPADSVSNQINLSPHVVGQSVGAC